MVDKLPILLGLHPHLHLPFTRKNLLGNWLLCHLRKDACGFTAGRMLGFSGRNRCVNQQFKEGIYSQMIMVCVPLS